MAVKTHILVDASESFVHDHAEIHHGDAPASNWQARLRTCRGGRSEGVQVVELDNGAMCIDVLPTRGMGIWRVRRDGKTLGWQAPLREPVHPCYVPLTEPSGLGWLSGFNELLCRCGLESNGAPEFDDSGRLVLPLHGRIANTPAHRVELIVDEDAGQVSIRGVVDEARFHFQALRLTSTISTTFGSNKFTWTDEVENIGGRDATLQMLYHFNLGQPLLRPGARISVPLKTVAPLAKTAAGYGVDSWNIMPPPKPGSPEQVFLMEPAAIASGDTRVLVTGLTDEEALSLQFNKRALPCFTIWRNTPAEADGYVLGIEPGTNFPNSRNFEKQNGRTISLKAGEKWQATVTATWHTDPNAISREAELIAAIQKECKLEVSAEPRHGWSKT